VACALLCFKPVASFTVFPWTAKPIFAGDGIRPAKSSKTLLQLILGYCCRVFFILNVLLVFGTNEGVINTRYFTAKLGKE
jgi:hypothetical protein